MNCLRTMAIAVMCATACSPEPLTTDQLYGATPDAGRVVDANVPKLPADTAVPDKTVPIDVMPSLDVMSHDTGFISGIVIDGCSREQINALVGIAGKHLCSFQGKGSFFFSGVPSSVNLTVTAGAPGYKGFSKAIVVDTNGTSNVQIELIRLGASTENGCDAPKPAAPLCICDRPGCSQ